MRELKKREKQMLDFLKNEIRQKGYPPTVREVCNALGIKSTSTAHNDLLQLEINGYIKRDPSKPRALMLTDEALKEDGENMFSHFRKADVVNVPVVGRIAAGTPILADENIEDAFPIPARFAPSGTSFMLSVRGDSMTGVGINDGDYILVRQQSTAENGEIVVAMVDGFESEATVKTFYKEDGRIRLQPENPSMSPIIVNDVKILGLVRGVFRYF
ncbi:MAG: transcriptional repressor LexA [Clostridiales Family XIII bacterium]|jgi:repressor LexA|nr:transcriptional repressor LexA [Clostridiales Family XIII bacterium]